MTTAREIMTGGAECIGEKETLAEAARSLPDDRIGDLVKYISEPGTSRT